MMRLRFTHALLAMLLLTREAAQGVASRRGGSSNRWDDITVSLLVCMLLLLLILLFLAWRHLNRKSEGRYHPQRLMRGLILHWQEFWGQPHSDELPHSYQDEKQSDEELGEQQHDDDMEEQQQDDVEKEQWKESLLQQAGSECEEERQERLDQSAMPEPLENRVEMEPAEAAAVEASRATGGRAETLLSDLHSFSGTATWEDSGKHAHVTAL